jgi:hypothetical protein
MIGMRLMIVVLLAGCGKKVELVGSSCADPAACLAECDSGIVVACDRGSQQSTDPAQRTELLRKGHELWSIACNIGNPEACKAGATDRMRELGVANPTWNDFATDHDACELYVTALAATGDAPHQPCP